MCNACESVGSHGLEGSTPCGSNPVHYLNKELCESSRYFLRNVATSLGCFNSLNNSSPLFQAASNNILLIPDTVDIVGSAFKILCYGYVMLGFFSSSIETHIRQFCLFLLSLYFIQGNKKAPATKQLAITSKYPSHVVTLYGINLGHQGTPKPPSSMLRPLIRSRSHPQHCLTAMGTKINCSHGHGCNGSNPARVYDRSDSSVQWLDYNG